MLDKWKVYSSEHILLEADDAAGDANPYTPYAILELEYIPRRSSN